MSAGRYSEAETRYNKLVLLEPSVAEVHATLGVIYFQQGKFEPSANELHRALKLRPNIPKADGLLAMCLSELGRFSEALPGLEKSFRQSTDLPIKRMSGLQLERAYSALNLDRKAVEVALDLEQSFGEDPEVLYNNERIFGNYAYLTVQKLNQAAPRSIWSHQAAAEAQESQGNYVAAIEEYRSVLGMAPGRLGVHYRLGRTFLSRWRITNSPADLESARSEFALEVQADPTNANAEYELGEIARKAAHLEEAQTFFEDAIRTHPQFTEAQLGLASVFAAQGKWQEATPHLERAVALRPDDEVAWYRLSQAYRAAGNTEAQKTALATFQRLHAEVASARDHAPQEVTQQSLDLSIPDGASR